MIDDRYKRLIKTLATTYKDRLGTNPRFNEQEFITNLDKFMDSPNFNFTPARKSCVDKMVEKYIEGKGPYANGGSPSSPAPVQEPINRGRLQAHKSDAGWQIFIDKIPVGQSGSYKEAGTIISWLECGGLDSLGLGTEPVEGADPDSVPF
jgi:hypothetical protein